MILHAEQLKLNDQKNEPQTPCKIAEQLGFKKTIEINT
jgi:hypothetical protein